MTRIGCAILGATGAVGQRFIQRLDEHPDFEVRSLVASDRSAGHRYQDAATWIQDTAMPRRIAAMDVETLEQMQARDDITVVFSALPSAEAGDVEAALAAAGYKVFTNASAHRMDADVPLLIPEVNPDHLELVGRQAGPGWIVANGNCSGIVLTLALAPLEREFGLEMVHVTTMQGLSGAGYPGVPSLDIIDNVVPYIDGEEEKLEEEPQKTLDAGFQLLATCTRVPVLEGHLESVHLRLARAATLDEVQEAFETFQGNEEIAALPSAPSHPIHVMTERDRPQPRRDRDREAGMAVSVGRLRLSEDGRWLRFVVLGHNTVRGAAGQSVLNAEYALLKGRI